MPELPQRNTIFHRIGRTVRYGIVVLGGSLLMMTLAYHATLWTLAREAPLVRPAPTPLAEEEILQGFSQNLTDLMREYLDRASHEGNPPSDDFQLWSRDYFGPRASEVRRRIQASPASGDALGALLAAADRMVAMAREPDQLNLRQLATDNVFDAAAAVEDRITASRPPRRKSP